MCEDDLPNLGRTSIQPRFKILCHLRCSLGDALCEDSITILGPTSTQPRLKILYHLRCSLGCALCEDSITILGQTSTQPRLKIHCTLVFQEDFWNVDLDLHLSVTDRCMLQVHILHQGFSTDLSVAVLCAKMIFQTLDKPRLNLDSRYFII